MKGIIGKKIGMTQIFKDDRVVPVTVIQVQPNVITQVKTEDRDGYNAIQIGMVEQVREKNINKPMRGHLAKAGQPSIRRVREVRMEELPENKVGDQLRADIFAADDFVDVVANSKGKGFQGVIKRHHFGGGKATHGSMFHRAPGSIGASAYPSRVWKGMGMPGRMGGNRVTVKNLRVVDVDAEKNLILIRGAVPGGRRGYVFLKSSKRGASNG